MAMKTAISFFKKTIVLSSVIICSAITLSSCNKDDDNPVNNNPYTISGNATGAQVVPSVSGSGTATINGTFDPTTRVLNYNTTWTNLSGSPTSAGFYTGASGANGTGAGDQWTLGSGLTGTGTFTSTMTLTADQASQLTSGNWYYSYGTTANPSGEVRGQITAIQ
jgi:hypothetical protein